MKLQTEQSIQQQMFVWYNNTFCLKHHNPRNLIFAVPNGGTRNIREALALKNTGVLSGVSDLIVIHNGKVLFIEVKLPNGKQSPSQLDFEQRVKELGFDYYLIRTFEQFKNIIHEQTGGNR